MIKEHVEDEKKMQNELRLKFMDFCIDTKIKYYIDPPPEKLPQMEEVRPDRFNIKQLNSLLADLRELSA